MKIRKAYIAVLMAFTLCLGACGNRVSKIDMWSGTGQEEQETQGQEGQGSEGVNTESENEEQEKAEQEKAEQERIQQEERRLHLTTAFNENLPMVEYGEERDSFVEWLLDTYSLEQLETIDF